MATRQLHRLNALRISKETTPGYYADGGGLYLQISASGSRSWIFRFSIAKRSREMGLGPLSSVSLAEARAQAANCRKLRSEGVDPIQARDDERARAAVASPEAFTFRQAAADYIATQEESWKNKKHAQQWKNTLDTYAYKVIGNTDVREVDTPMIVRILQPIWLTKPETASRVRGRIESVLDASKALGKRSGENPARWRGHLEQILPKRKRARRVKHHPALPYAKIPEFMQELRAREGVSARMLEHLILTAVRTQEVLYARPEEFLLAHKLWTVPGERMKMELPLRVPLTDRVVELVKQAQPRYGWLYPGHKKGKPLSNMAMLNLLDRMGYGDITVHGFRSTFRDWVAECTEYPGELAEMALAHAVESKVEGAYRRGDMLERRRRMMEEWARYCNSPPARVLPINQQTAA